MGNPFCPNKGCKTLLQIKRRTTLVEAALMKEVTDEKTKEVKKVVIKPARYGLAKFYVCPKCKVAWQCGCEVILPKSKPLTDKEVAKNLEQVKEIPLEAIGSDNRKQRKPIPFEQLQHQLPRKLRRRVAKIVKKHKEKEE